MDLDSEIGKITEQLKNLHLNQEQKNPEDDNHQNIHIEKTEENLILDKIKRRKPFILIFYFVVVVTLIFNTVETNHFISRLCNLFSLLNATKSN